MDSIKFDNNFSFFMSCFDRFNSENDSFYFCRPTVLFEFLKVISSDHYCGFFFHNQFKEENLISQDIVSFDFSPQDSPEEILARFNDITSGLSLGDSFSLLLCYSQSPDQKIIRGYLPLYPVISQKNLSDFPSFMEKITSLLKAEESSLSFIRLLSPISQAGVYFQNGLTLPWRIFSSVINS